MATTAQQIFEMAMHLADEVNESSGLADTPDTKEYKNRTLPILNILRNEVFPYSSNYRPARYGARPVCPMIQSMTSNVALDDSICQGILPYGLAAHLFLDENPNLSAYFNQKYEEGIARYRVSAPSYSEPIVDVYGGIEMGEHARWD